MSAYQIIMTLCFVVWILIAGAAHMPLLSASLLLALIGFAVREKNLRRR